MNKKKSYHPDEQEALNSIMQDLAELHRSSRPAVFPSDLGKPKASSPKNQVWCWVKCQSKCSINHFFVRCGFNLKHEQITGRIWTYIF